jgi:hypothetical protein
MISSIDDYCSEVEGILDANLAKLDALNIDENINEEKVLAVYDKCKKYFEDCANIKENDIKPKLDLGSLVLNPNEINYLYNFEGLQIYIHEDQFSICMNPIVQTSYDAGHNDFFFVLDDDNTLYTNAAANFVATADNPLKITIKGNVGYFFGRNSSYIDVSILGDGDAHLGYRSSNFKVMVRGNVSYEAGVSSTNMALFVGGNANFSCGKDSTNLSTIIKGDVENHFGFNSKNLFAIIKGNAKRYFATHSINLDVNVAGQIDFSDFFYYTKKSTFESSNVDTLIEAKKTLRHSGRMLFSLFNVGSNKLIEIQSDGSKEQIGRFT